MRVLSYNIHKGYGRTNFRFTLKIARRLIHSLDADIVCLQEVQAEHVGHRRHFPSDTDFSLLNYLAGERYPFFVYGRNAVYKNGHHGNAIFSRYPIQFSENEDVSYSRMERRGLLHATLKVPGSSQPVHIICTHLGLFETDRERQSLTLCKRIEAMVPHSQPLIVAGDFNDWRQRLTLMMKKYVGMKEVFLELNQEHAATFPSWLPVFRLDRIYYRGVKAKFAACLHEDDWSGISDHLGILAEFDLKN